MQSNRLRLEKSPYLQQHAFNPVDWFPWGTEALEKARRENKPIFLSVGYSTCHWCHVMEHESFENSAIAELLNRYFVSVKVDREERPDVDRVYMAYVQAATGAGGWPMSVWLTPEGAPFVGGTYFPPEDRYGRPGFASVLQRIAQAWASEHERIVESGAAVVQQLKQQGSSREGGSPTETDEHALHNAYRLWERSFDARLGGFGQAPKFPRPAILHFLLRYWARYRSEPALHMVRETLTAMFRGGINDQLGGGFHRYSVDEYWFVPHFEKMLYDQAQLASSLIETFQITREPIFANEVRRVLDYVLRDMTDAEGCFYSAEDADSAFTALEPKRKGEGAFYIWSAAEIEAVLGQQGVALFNHRFGVESDGNVENDPHREFVGRNILFEAQSVEETAHHFDQPPIVVEAALREASLQLLRVRAQRPRPHLDDKVLTSWNALMISAFAQAGFVLDESRYRNAARSAADRLIQRMWNPQTEVLLRRYREGEAAIPGFLDDYAFLIRALLDLYETQFQIRDLELATTLAARMLELFRDPEGGALFSTAHEQSGGALVLRMKDDYDGAEPSGNSIAAISLLRLAALTGQTDFQKSGDELLRAFDVQLRSQPYGVPLMLSALDWTLSPPRQVVIAGEPDAPETEALLRKVAASFQPARVVLLVNSASREWLSSGHPELQGMRPVDGKSAAYVCENFVCQLPVTDPEELIRLLQ